MKITTHCLSLMVIMAFNRLSAQLEPPFQLFADSLISSGFLKDQSPGWLNIDEWSGDQLKLLSPAQGQQLFLELGEASLGSANICSIGELRDSVIQLHVQTGTVPVVILDFNYERIVPWAIPQSLIDTSGGVFTPLVPQAELLETKSLSALFTIHDELMPGARIVFNSSLFFSNQEPAEMVEYRFNNGMDFLPVIWDTPIAIPDGTEDLELIIKLQRNGDSFFAGTKIKRSKCEAPYDPDLAPWPSENEDFPWQISADYNGETVYANAYIKYRNGVNGTISKPFIFVEGIDFNISNVYPDKYGNFGWCEFASGSSPEYDFLYNMPVLVESLRADGFDIIFLDFLDGADLVQKNSTLLRKLLDLLEIYKVSDNPNVVSGASMGGQITRYTLAKMEEEGVSHCTNLWISLDSPHLGANIPMGLQEMLLFLANNGNAEAQLRLEGSLYRPAAQQMLIDQLNAPNFLFNEWYAELQQLGFPGESRNVAMANGSIDGLAQEPFAGTAIIDYTVDVLGEAVAWLQAFAAPGMDVGFPGTRAIFSGRIPTGSTMLPDWLGGDCVPYEFESSLVLYPQEQLYPHESVPGSTRPTIEEIVEAINSVLEADECEAPLVQLNQDTHSFISTQSALAIEHDNLLESVEEILFYGLANTPFDAFYAPSGVNERHSEISDAALEFVLNEVRAGQWPITEILAPGMNQPPVFNFGSERMKYIHSLEVGNGGELHINAQMPIHFGDDPDWIPAVGSELEVRIGSCGSGLELKSGSELHIGSADGLSRGKLIVSRDAYLAIENGAKIYVYPGSELVFEGHAVMSIYGGVIEVLDGAKVKFESGSHTEIYGNSDWLLSGAQAEVILNNQMHVNSGVQWNVWQTGEDSQLLVLENCHVNSEPNALISISGNADNTFLYLANNSELIFNGFEAKLYLQDENIRFEGEAVIATEHELRITRCDIQSLGMNDEWIVFNKSLISDSYIQGVLIEANFTQNSLALFKANLTEFSGYDKGFRQHGGRYSIQSCEFNDGARVKSAGLSGTSVIATSSFAQGFVGSPSEVYNQSDFGFEDVSSAKIHVTDCSFSGFGGSAIFKSMGQIYLKCNEIRDCHTGLFLLELAKGFMDTGNAAGYNVLENNRFNIRLENAQSLHLRNGFNVLAAFHEYNIAGSLSGFCNCTSSTWLDATRNTWSNQGVLSAPLPSHFNVWRLANCILDPWQVSCEIPVLDPHPAMQACPGILVASEGKSLDPVTSALTVYPNPGNWPIRISSEKEIDQVVLFDSQGKQIHFLTLPSSGVDFLYSGDGKSQGLMLMRIYFRDGSSESVKVYIGGW